MVLIFQTELLIYQSKASLDKKILFDKITHHLDLEISKMPVRGLYGNRILRPPKGSRAPSLQGLF